MSMNDPIADMLNRVRNAASNHAPQVTIRNSGVCRGIAQVLKDEGFINDFAVIEDEKQGLLRIDLKYGPRGEDLMHRIKRVSRPGCRVYRSVEELPRVLDGLGIAIVSTSSGILSDRQAREKRVGGELLATIE